jgi:hypothetical protein
MRLRLPGQGQSVVPTMNPYIGFGKDRRQTYSSGERFSTGQLEPEQLNGRCVRLLVNDRLAKLGVDPTCKPGVRRPEDVFQQHLEDNRRILSIARPVIDNVTERLGDTPACGIVL